MFRKITSFLAAVSVLLAMQFAECQAMSADQQTMKCCRKMPCNPANHKQDCCKKMVSSQASVLPSPHVPLIAPLALPADPLPAGDVLGTTEIFWPRIEFPEHSPPNLYIVYASLLI